MKILANPTNLTIPSIMAMANPTLLKSSANQKNQTAGTNTSGYYAIDYYIAHNLGVAEVFVADEHNICLTLPYKPGSGKVAYVDVPAG